MDLLARVAVGMAMSRCSAGQPRGENNITTLDDALHSPQVFRGSFHFVAVPGEGYHLNAGVPFEVDVRRGPHMGAPSVGCTRHPPLHVRRVMPVQDGHGSDYVGLGISDNEFSQLLADEKTNSIGAAPRVTARDPEVEAVEQDRFH